MHQFKDEQGRSWDLELTLYQVKQLQGIDIKLANKTVRVDLLSPTEEMFNEILMNREVVFGVIWCLCESQASERGIADEMEFARLFSGDVFEAAHSAFYEELADFFPEMRTTLTTLIGRLKKAREMAGSKISQMLEEQLNDEKLEEMMDQLSTSPG